MIERIKNLPPDIDGIHLGGTIEREDIVDVLLPLLQAAKREGRKLRIVAEVDATFRGVALEAVWEELRIGLRALGSVERCAVLSDLALVRASARLKAVFSDALHCDIGVFDENDWDRALAWLAAPAAEA